MITFLVSMNNSNKFTFIKEHCDKYPGLKKIGNKINETLSSVEFHNNEDVTFFYLMKCYIEEITSHNSNEINTLIYFALLKFHEIIEDQMDNSYHDNYYNNIIDEQVDKTHLNKKKDMGTNLQKFIDQINDIYHTHINPHKQDENSSTGVRCKKNK